MTPLQATDIRFAYGDRLILDDVGFRPLEPGSITALIGPNASGKSTLFRVLAGLLKPTGGQVLLGDIDLDTLSSRNRLKRVCFMPQFFAANAVLTVFDVVMMAHKQLQGWRVLPEDMDLVAASLERAGVGHLSDAYINELSGGQAQMVSVAQALIRTADVYLFDEPTSALDLRHQLAVLDRIRNTIKQRHAIGIIALHDLNLAARFADNLLLLGQGRILAQGATEEVLSSPAIASTYGVEIEVITGPRKDILVHAYPA